MNSIDNHPKPASGDLIKFKDQQGRKWWGQIMESTSERDVIGPPGEAVPGPLQVEIRAIVWPR